MLPSAFNCNYGTVMQETKRDRAATSAAELVAAARRLVDTCTPAEAAERLYTAPDTRIMDVREPAEYESGHLPAAVNLPRGVLEFQIEKVCPLRDQPLMVHCAGGGRAVLAAKTLLDMGYARVTAVDGKFTDLQVCVNASPGG